jgi:hypothetical protein
VVGSNAMPDPRHELDHPAPSVCDVPGGRTIPRHLHAAHVWDGSAWWEGGGVSRGGWDVDAISDVDYRAMLRGRGQSGRRA